MKLYNLLALFGLFLGLVGAALVFAKDALFRDAQNKMLSLKFENWWRIVERYDKNKLALVFVRKINGILDSSFGTKHFSKRLIVKSSLISSGFLLMTLSVSALKHHTVFGVAPWTTYHDAVKFILKTTEDLGSERRYTTLLSLDLNSVIPDVEHVTNSKLSGMESNYYLVSHAPLLRSNTLILHIGTNDWLVKVQKSVLYDLEKVVPVGHGNFYIKYGRRFADDTNDAPAQTNGVADLSNLTNSFSDMRTNLMQIHNKVAHYDTSTWTALYSAAFYIGIFGANILMFIVSLAFGRTILREVANSRRMITTGALLFTNFVFVVVACCIFILILTVLAIPLFWLLLPLMVQVSMDSLYFTSAFLLSSAMFILMSIGTSTKIILFIALLPSCLALAVGACSWGLMRWRKLFHYILLRVLIRCAEKTPFGFLGAIILLIGAAIVFATEFIHVLGFL
jgi:hypothetical protein